MSKRWDEHAVFRALGNRRRRQILALVTKKARTPGDIAKEFDVSWPAISRHISVLVDAELIAMARDGDGDPGTYYPVTDTVDRAVRWLKGFGSEN